MNTEGLLTGTTVLDMTNVLAGPFAAYQLSLAGADVIKVEVPGSGDLGRQLGASKDLNQQQLGASFVAQNSGKRSIALNLKTEGGREAFIELLRLSDVLIENFRPGVLARLGFPQSVLEEINPRLVYCAISGFGQSGPMRDRPAYDQIIQGLSGMMESSGTPDSGPMRAGYPVADTLGGMAAAFAISSALTARERTGRGSTLDVSMLETAMTAMGWVVSNFLLADQEPERIGNENFTAAPSGTFDTGDGQINISANKQEQFEILCTVLDREDLSVDPRFAAREDRKANRRALKTELESELLRRSAAEWEAALVAVGVPAGRVLGIADALELEQIRERELVHQVPHPLDESAVLRVMGNGIRTNGHPSEPSGGPPLRGQHTEEILRQAGLSTERIEQLRQEGAVE